MSKTFPRFSSDKEAEDFVESADLSEYDFTDFKRVHFERDDKLAHIDLQLPAQLFTVLSRKAAAEGMSTTDFIQQLIERDLEKA